MTMLGNLDHYRAFRTEGDIRDSHLIPFRVDEAGARSQFSHGTPPKGPARSEHPERQVCPVLWLPVGGA